MSENGGNDESDGNDGDRDDAPAECDDGRDRAKAHDDRPAGSVTLSLDATLELLANHDRRAIVAYLRDASDRTATVSELSDHLVERRAERTGERPGQSHVYSTLYHIHIPKLVDAGVVDYDARTEEVRYWGSERLETWHDRIERNES
ncbi:hypothetical protein M0R88_11685 [Halorussus gelatinilyticus]|uniref:DUF7344 domain-containing protein n=1 Tax=Halorussus gelatinilyticus TaxID=2937524 RepID=A0A8U0IDR0_9EURY|nr:hypothetical protein [Halorussus gelatinilyticus]UPV99186.1 hypothetical protein M0R88_11685 [Halorussus gelatinilyticus]